jgi:uncharacterized RDD family membrane protein YckC
MEQTDVLGRRIGAAIIDIGIAIIIVLLVGSVIGNDVASDAPTSARFGTLDRVVIIALVFAYYFVTELVWGQTVGKRVLDIRVERVDGTKATPGAIFVRTLLRAIDGIFFYLVALIAVLATGPRRQRLGDLAAKTRVVSASQPPRDPSAPPERPERPPDEDVIAQIMR